MREPGTSYQLQGGCEAVAVLKRVTAAERGGRPGFTSWHVVEALRRLSRYELGRIALSRELGLTEASTKTLIRRLLGESLITKGDFGSRTTDRGLRLLSVLESLISPRGCSVTELGDLRSCLFITLSLEPPRDLTQVYEIRDYVVAEGCRLVVVGYLDPPRLGFPGLPAQLEEAIGRAVTSTGVSGAGKGTVIVVPSTCGPALVNAVVEIIARACGLGA